MYLATFPLLTRRALGRSKLPYLLLVAGSNLCSFKQRKRVLKLVFEVVDIVFVVKWTTVLPFTCVLSLHVVKRRQRFSIEGLGASGGIRTRDLDLFVFEVVSLTKVALKPPD